MYIKKERNHQEKKKQEKGKQHHPLFVGVIYLVEEDLSVDIEVSIIESSYCSPSSLCFSTRNRKQNNTKIR